MIGILDITLGMTNKIRIVNVSSDCMEGFIGDHQLTDAPFILSTRVRYIQDHAL